MAEDQERLRQLELAKAKLKLQQQTEQANQQQEIKESKKDLSEQGIGAKALDAGIRALDFTGGLARTGLASLADVPEAVGAAGSAAFDAAKSDDPFSDAFMKSLAKQDTNFVTRPGDIESALKGQAPSTSQFLERKGVGNLGSLSDVIPIEKGSALDVTGRGAIGFAGDVLLDPLNLVTGGAASALRKGAKAGSKSVKAAKGLEAVVNPVAKATENAGEGLFRSAFKKTDLKITGGKKGAGRPLSDQLLEEGVFGTRSSILDKIEGLNKTDLKKRNRLLTKAGEEGHKIDPRKALSAASRKIDDIAETDPQLASGLRKTIDKLIKTEEIFDPQTANFIRKTKEFTPKQATQIKTRFQKLLPDAAFDRAGFMSSDAKQVTNLIQKGFRKEVEKIPGIGKDVKALNRRLSTQIKALPQEQRATIAEASQKILTQPKAALAAINPAAALGALAAQGAATTPFKTGVGLGLQRFGKLASDPGLFAPALDTVLRRGAINLNKDQ